MTIVSALHAVRVRLAPYVACMPCMHAHGLTWVGSGEPMQCKYAVLGQAATLQQPCNTFVCCRGKTMQESKAHNAQIAAEEQAHREAKRLEQRYRLAWVSVHQLHTACFGESHMQSLHVEAMTHVSGDAEFPTWKAIKPADTQSELSFSI